MDADDGRVRPQGGFGEWEWHEQLATRFGVSGTRRWLRDFDANGPLPVDEIDDWAFYVQAAFFPIEKKLELYAATSWVFADEDAGYDTSHEYLIGANWYPFDTRNARLNVQSILVEDSPVSSSFGFYQGGLDGVSLSIGASVFF